MHWLLTGSFLNAAWAVFFLVTTENKKVEKLAKNLLLFNLTTLPVRVEEKGGRVSQGR